MNKRLLSLVALSLAGMMALTACSGKDSDDNEESAPDGDEQVELIDEDEYVEDDGFSTWHIALGHSGGEESAQHVGALAMKEYIESVYPERITVELYPDNSMGSDREMCESVRDGALTMCIAGAAQVEFVPDAAIYDLYYQYQIIDQVMSKFRNDEVFNEIMARKYREAGYKLTGYSIHGFRQTTAKKEILTPDDLAGVSFRVQENDYQAANWEALGASPVSVDADDVYSALQRGLINAQEAPIEQIYNDKLYEQQEYVIMTNHQQQVLTWLMNDEMYLSMPTDLRAAVMDGVRAGREAAENHSFANESELRQALREQGVTFVELTETQYYEFREKVSPVADKIKADVSPEVWIAYTEV